MFRKTALGICLLTLGCTSENNTNKAAKLTIAPPQSLPPLPGYLADLTQPASASQFAAYVSTVETQTPRQNPHNFGLKKKSTTNCSNVGGKVDLSIQTYATAGVYSQAVLASSNGSTNYGYALAVIDNPSPCQPISIPLAYTTASDNGTTIVFFALDKPAHPNDPPVYNLYFVDSTTMATVAKFPLATCPPTGNPHPWYGDHSMAKKWDDPNKNTGQCDHAPPFAIAAVPNAAAQTNSAKTMAHAPATLPVGGDIDQPWTLWISCAADCCYADTGGLGTKDDTSHHDTTGKKVATPPKKA